ncbi:MAG: glycosyltransferase family 2 protein [Lentisphaerae bacterium]|mgnify:CR=1 FL=1|nr:glycosyltransferase family 2 protein [Lentisphaerota bacterium]
MNTPLKTPVAFIIFNRPKCTRRVFERIRDARPEKLYLIADAPRSHKPGEAATCAETRRIVEKMIDWPCEVHKNYADKNMGCRWRVASGINWVFDHEEMAIILEDDCLPDPSFFPFCQEMLSRYKDNPTIMQICGTNNINYTPESSSSYFFSRFTPIWGWATWRRAWDKYDQQLEKWPAYKRCRLLYEICLSDHEASVRENTLDRIYRNELDTWDYGWVLSIMVQQALGIIPRKNLIKNIGFGDGATHTHNPFNPMRLLSAKSLEFPLRHPEKISADQRHEYLYHRRHYDKSRHIEWIKSLLTCNKGNS